MKSQSKSMDELVDQLKLLLVNSKDLSKIMAFFFDELMMKPGFIPAGTPCQGDQIPTQIVGVVEAIYQERFGQDPRGSLQVISMLRLPQYKLIHGACMVNGKLGALFFFEDLDMGLLSLGGMPPDSEVLHARFQAIAMPRDNKKRGVQVDRSGYRH